MKVWQTSHGLKPPDSITKMGQKRQIKELTLVYFTNELGKNDQYLFTQVITIWIKDYSSLDPNDIEVKSIRDIIRNCINIFLKKFR